MSIIAGGIMGAVVFVILITGKFAHELSANRKRAERGEPPKKYHDATDDPPPVNVIDWTRR